MILRGLWRLACAERAGIAEFGNSLDAFTTSLAPLIAFPLVGAGVSILAGQWQIAVIGFLSRLCAVLVLPVIIHEFARRSGREAVWLRTATALDWSFWTVLPVLFLAAFIGAILVEATGISMLSGEYFAIGLVGGYLLWLHWFIIRSGLDLGRLHAALLVAFNSFVLLVFSIVPVLLDPADYARISAGFAS